MTALNALAGNAVLEPDLPDAQRAPARPPLPLQPQSRQVGPGGRRTSRHDRRPLPRAMALRYVNSSSGTCGPSSRRSSLPWNNRNDSENLEGGNEAMTSDFLDHAPQSPEARPRRDARRPRRGARPAGLAAPARSPGSTRSRPAAAPMSSRGRWPPRSVSSSACQILIDNKGGAGGTVGASQAAKMKPDGSRPSSSAPSTTRSPRRSTRTSTTTSRRTSSRSPWSPWCRRSSRSIPTRCRPRPPQEFIAYVKANPEQGELRLGRRRHRAPPGRRAVQARDQDRDRRTCPIAARAPRCRTCSPATPT
jgi:hypothetical protein